MRSSVPLTVFIYRGLVCLSVPSQLCFSFASESRSLSTGCPGPPHRHSRPPHRHSRESGNPGPPSTSWTPSASRATQRPSPSFPSLTIIPTPHRHSRLPPSFPRKRESRHPTHIMVDIVLPAKNGAPGRGRTCDPRLRRPMLYPLSYRRVEIHNEIGTKRIDWKEK